MSWCRRIGCATSRVSPSSSGIGSVHTSWCCTASNATGTPASAPTLGPQIPAQSRTRSHWTSPRSVRTPWTRPSRRSNPFTVTPPSNATPLVSALAASAAAIRTPLAIPSEGTWYAPRIVDGSSSGTLAAASAGVRSSAPSSPYERANPSRRFSSRIRASDVATSIPPTPYQAGSPSCSRVAYSATDSWAIRHIMREPLVWKARPGACVVEPPVSNSGPWSRTRTSGSPSSARW